MLRVVKPSVLINSGIRFLAGFLVLVGFLLLGRVAREQGHLPLSAAVIGLTLLAAVLIGLELRAPAVARTVFAGLTPASRPLITHLGLLFIPAGVGVMTQSELLRSQWLPVVAGLVGSTWAGIAVTGWVMQRLAPAAKTPPAR
jgi:putative effector of murein hydrolase LrgA (UPF0299 family)